MWCGIQNVYITLLIVKDLAVIKEEPVCVHSSTDLKRLPCPAQNKTIPHRMGGLMTPSLWRKNVKERLGWCIDLCAVLFTTF